MAKRKSTGPITAGELMARLEADPEWVARHAKKEAEREELDRRLAENEAPIVTDLCRAGFKVESVYDLVNSRTRYTEAVPILLSHLKKGTVYDRRIREGIARALTVKDAKHAVPELLEAFRQDPDTSLNGPKGALGNAICTLADKSYLDDVFELALDRKHGAGRWALVEWLGRQPAKVVSEALNELTSDPIIEVSLTAKKALKGGYRRRWRRRS